MWKLLAAVNKKLVIAIPVMMTAGFLFGVSQDPEIVRSLRKLILPLTFLMVYPMMVTLDFKRLKDGISNFRIQISALIINFMIIPFLAYALGTFFLADRPYMALGLLLVALLPSSGMTISWTGFAKGNTGAAFNLTAIGLLAGSLAAPLYIQWLMGTRVDVDPVMMSRQILYIVFIPMIAGYLTRKMLLSRFSPTEFKEKVAPRFPALSTIGVLAIVFVALAMKASTITANPKILAAIVAPLLIFYVVNFSVSTLIGRFFFTRDDAVALVYGTVIRNLSIALAIAMNTFGSTGSDAALIITISYIIQVQSAAWFIKLADFVFVPSGH
ncbi:MAG: bile acid:sodium symporter [Proteobacteria bacterium]|nr:bile acid:sodium symporter [Pseudomonadota bacterium]MBU1738471.1 bile acid:sodium symporter [Pseudomonadota bacterium]